MTKLRCPALGCKRRFKDTRALDQHMIAKHGKENSKVDPAYEPETAPDWDGQCSVCGTSPIVPVTGLCGPCTWGEADTIGGNW